MNLLSMGTNRGAAGMNFARSEAAPMRTAPCGRVPCGEVFDSFCRPLVAGTGATLPEGVLDEGDVTPVAMTFDIRLHSERRNSCRSA